MHWCKVTGDDNGDLKFPDTGWLSQVRENGGRKGKGGKGGEGRRQAISHEGAQKPGAVGAQRRGFHQGAATGEKEEKRQTSVGRASCTGESDMHKEIIEIIRPRQQVCHPVPLPDAQDSRLGSAS